MNTLDFGEWLKTKRQELKMSQRELADVTDISNGTIANIEIGRRSASADAVHKLAKAFDMPVEDMRRLAGLDIGYPIKVDISDPRLNELVNLAKDLDPVRLEALVNVARLMPKRDLNNLKIDTNQDDD